MNLQEEAKLLSLRGAAALVVFLLGLLIYGAWANYRAHGGDSALSDATGYSFASSFSDEDCNVAVIPLQGDIVPYAAANQDGFSGISGDQVAAQIRDADQSDNIRGIVLQIDSGGGDPAASEQIMRALQNEKKPTAAYIRTVGASGAYLAASGANTIIANDFADVGSIGVTYSYVSNADENAKQGLSFVQLSSGQFKDTGNPNKPVTAAERALYDRDIKIYADLFVSYVAKNRNIPKETVSALADGSTMPASLALQHKLVDSVGDEGTVKDWFTKKFGSDATLCDPLSTQ
jgi:protease-4